MPFFDGWLQISTTELVIPLSDPCVDASVLHETWLGVVASLLMLVQVCSCFSRPGEGRAMYVL